MADQEGFFAELAGVQGRLFMGHSYDLGSYFFRDLEAPLKDCRNGAKVSHYAKRDQPTGFFLRRAEHMSYMRLRGSVRNSFGKLYESRKR